jgi:hypothetical protein
MRAKTQIVQCHHAHTHPLSLAYDTDELASFYNESYHLANTDQKIILDRLNLAMENKKDEGELFFLDAPGGTGKTFVLNSFLVNQRSKRRIVCAVQ